MESKNYQIEVFNLLEKQETRVSELYAVFAEMFPEYHQFWSSLSKEEEEHARWIRRLAEEARSGKVSFSKERFSLEAIAASLKGLEGDIAKVKRSSISLTSALQMSYYYELALIEREFFEIFESDCAEMKRALTDLSRETQRHQQTVKKMLDKEMAKHKEKAF